MSETIPEEKVSGEDVEPLATPDTTVTEEPTGVDSEAGTDADSQGS